MITQTMETDVAEPMPALAGSLTIPAVKGYETMGSIGI